MINLPTHGAVSVIGRLVDQVALSVPPIKIGVLPFYAARFLPDMLGFGVRGIRHVDLLWLSRGSSWVNVGARGCDLDVKSLRDHGFHLLGVRDQSNRSFVVG